VIVYLSKLDGVEFDKEYYFLGHYSDPGKISKQKVIDYLSELSNAQLLPLMDSAESEKVLSRFERINNRTVNNDHIVSYWAKMVWSLLTPHSKRIFDIYKQITS